MASLAHLELVRLGADAIAKWHKNQKPGERSGLDLSGATLKGVQLRVLDLEFADLSGVMAGSADFSRSNLRYSRMTRANLGPSKTGGCRPRRQTGRRCRRVFQFSSLNVISRPSTTGTVRSCGRTHSILLRQRRRALQPPRVVHQRTGTAQRSSLPHWAG
jgi:hypothetical protein